MRVNHMKKGRRTVAANLELPLFGQMRHAALAAVKEEEDMRGAYQRYLVKAITSQLIVDGYWPLNDIDIPGVPAGRYTEYREMPPIRPLERRPARASVEEAQAQIERLRALEFKDGQYPAVASRVRKERMAWDEELQKRIAAKEAQNYALRQATEGRVMDEPPVEPPEDEPDGLMDDVEPTGINRLADERGAVEHDPGEDII